MESLKNKEFINSSESNRSKRKSADFLVKEISKRQDIYTKEYNFYIVLTRPNIELIWCEEHDGLDGYTHPIYVEIKNRTAWMVRNRFFACHSWRCNRDDDSVVYNVTPNRVGQSSYPRRYFLRIMDNNESTHQTRYNILKECAMVRKEIYGYMQYN
jgi:hypothetical protein